MNKSNIGKIIKFVSPVATLLVFVGIVLNFFVHIPFGKALILFGVAIFFIVSAIKITKPNIKKVMKVLFSLGALLVIGGLILKIFFHSNGETLFYLGAVIAFFSTAVEFPEKTSIENQKFKIKNLK